MTMTLFPQYPGNRYHISDVRYYFCRAGLDEVNLWLKEAKLPAGTVVGLYVSVGRIAEDGDHLDEIGEKYIDLCEKLGLLSRRPTDDEIAIHRWVARRQRPVDALRKHGLHPVFVEGSDNADPAKREAARILGVEIISLSEWRRRGGPGRS